MSLARVGNQLFDPAAVVAATLDGDAGGGVPESIRLVLANGHEIEFRGSDAAAVWERLEGLVDNWCDRSKPRFGFA